mmetsp:Transcript_42297/g.92325  ORF Transcript_42297/g.92325 Transcript_42297/m.92325 type:complete len:221 (-) Transcript_42297:2782-3444(-)
MQRLNLLGVRRTDSYDAIGSDDGTLRKIDTIMESQVPVRSLGQTQKWANWKPGLWVLPLVAHIVRNIHAPGVSICALRLAGIGLSILVRHVNRDQSGLPIIRDKQDFFAQVEASWAQNQRYLKGCERQQRKTKQVIFVLHTELRVVVQTARSTVATMSHENIVCPLPVFLLLKLMEICHFVMTAGKPDRCAANVIGVWYIIVHRRHTNKEVVSPRELHRV